MKCPRGHPTLLPFPFGTGFISQCASCHGLWLPLELIPSATRTRSLADQLVAAADPASHIHCPVDGTPMRETSRKGVRIDYCPTCRGLWLDDGELSELRRRYAGSQPPRPGHRGWTGDAAEGAATGLLDLLWIVVEFLLW